VAHRMNESEGAGGATPPAPPATSQVSINTGPANRPTATTELLRAEAGDVKADRVAMERAGAEHVSAERVIMANSGARTVDAKSAQIDRSGILMITSEKAVLYNSTAVAAAVDEARIVRGKVLALRANEATIEGDARIGIYAGPVAGCTQPLIDVRGAAAFGAAFGAVLVLLGTLLRRIADRS
jgi:hypothetical protein